MPKLSETGSLTKSRALGDAFSCPKAWQTSMLETFEGLARNTSEQPNEKIDERVTQGWRDLNILESTSAEPSTLEGIAENLHRLLEVVLISPDLQHRWNHFAAGKGFLSYVQITGKMGKCDKNLWPLLCSSSPYFANRPKFLEALFAYISNFPQYVPFHHS
jgi:hypothetical protein